MKSTETTEADYLSEEIDHIFCTVCLSCQVACTSGNKEQIWHAMPFSYCFFYKETSLPFLGLKCLCGQNHKQKETWNIHFVKRRWMRQLSWQLYSKTNNQEELFQRNRNNERKWWWGRRRRWYFQRISLSQRKFFFFSQMEMKFLQTKRVKESGGIIYKEDDDEEWNTSASKPQGKE